MRASRVVGLLRHIERFVAGKRISWRDPEASPGAPAAIYNLPSPADIFTLFVLGGLTAANAGAQGRRQTVHFCFTAEVANLIVACRLQWLVPQLGLPGTMASNTFWWGHPAYTGEREALLPDVVLP